MELIQQQQYDENKFKAQLVEWQTKNIASMFSVAARDKKQARAIEKAVKAMKLPLANEEADLIDNRSFEEIVEQGAKVDFTSQPSFEQLEKAFTTGL